MTTKDKVLNILKDNMNTWVSSAQIIEITDVSRAAINKHISRARQSGYIIESATNRGYRLVKETSLVLEQEIRHELATHSFGKSDIYYYDTLSSSNTKAIEYALQNKKEGVIVISEGQTEGKSRDGLKWSSPELKGIYLSIILRPNSPEETNSSYISIAAKAASTAISSITKTEVDYSDEGDIFINSKKVGGVLVESLLHNKTIKWSVVGLGINVSNKKTKNTQSSISSILNETKIDVKRSELIKKYLEQLEMSYFELMDIS